MEVFIRRILVITILLAPHGVSLSQQRGWILTLANHTTLDSTVLIAIVGDSLQLSSRGNSIVIPVDSIIEIRRTGESAVAMGAFIGALAGIGIGEILYSLDAFPQLPESPGRLVNYFVGMVLGAGGGTFVALVAGTDEVYNFINFNHLARLNVLHRIVAKDKETFLQ